MFHWTARAPDEIPAFAIDGELDDSSSDEGEEQVQLGRGNDGQQIGPKYQKAYDERHTVDRSTNLDQEREWHKRMPEQYAKAQVTRVEGSASGTMGSEW